MPPFEGISPSLYRMKKGKIILYYCLAKSFFSFFSCDIKAIDINIKIVYNNRSLIFLNKKFYKYKQMKGRDFMTFGSKIKQRRILMQLTQEELADRSEVTKGYISQIENDLTSPSISTLTDILSALGTDLKEFFSDDEDTQIVFRKEDYMEKDTDGQKMIWLVPNAQKNEMEPILFEIQPNTKTIPDMPHEGQEFGYILEGEIVITWGNRKYNCKKGETFYYTTSKSHTIENKTNKIAKIIWVSSPPNF